MSFISFDTFDVCFKKLFVKTTYEQIHLCSLIVVIVEKAFSTMSSFFNVFVISSSSTLCPLIFIWY